MKSGHCPSSLCVWEEAKTRASTLWLINSHSGDGLILVHINGRCVFNFRLFNRIFNVMYRPGILSTCHVNQQFSYRLDSIRPSVLGSVCLILLWFDDFILSIYLQIDLQISLSSLPPGAPPSPTSSPPACVRRGPLCPLSGLSSPPVRRRVCGARAAVEECSCLALTS